MIEDHLSRMEYQLLGQHDLGGVSKFITEHTYIRGSLYSFDGHEFQKWIVEDKSVEANVQKVSQVGLSETMARWMLGTTAVIPYLSTIYTMPYSGDAEDFAKSRVDIIVDNSPRLTQLRSRSIWNSSIKQLGQGMMYFRGTNSETAAISVPADVVISDEIDRSNPEILDQYASRLTHSPWQLRRNFSTPTVEKRGIDAKMRTSKRMKNMCQCGSCNHWFYPDYYRDVKIPGFSGDLRDIDKEVLTKIQWQLAYVACPRCGIFLDIKNCKRVLVCENPDQPYIATGYYVSPFDAPKIITPANLVKKSTDYRRKSEFHNQNLGIVSEEKEDTLSQDDLNACKLPGRVTMPYNAMGCDMGMTCNIVIGRYVDNEFVLSHAERVPLASYEARRSQLMGEYNVIGKVQDAMPYTDMLFRLQAVERDLYGAYYTTTKQMFEIVENDDNDLKPSVVNINKTVLFDELLFLFKKGRVKVANIADWEIFCTQMQDMKKVPKINNKGELTYVWEKSEEGNDHYHHALAYCLIASMLPIMMHAGIQMPLLDSYIRR